MRGGGGEEREPGTHCLHMLSSLGNCHTTLINWPHALQSYTACEIPSGGFEVRNNAALMVTVSIASFEVIGEL